MTSPSSSTQPTQSLLACLVLVGWVGLIGAGCGSSSSNLRSDLRAFFEYKRATVSRNADKLTPAQRSLVMYHSGPNATDVDSFVDSLVESNLRHSDALLKARDSGVEIGESVRVQGERSPYFFEGGESSSSGVSEGSPVGDGLSGDAGDG